MYRRRGILDELDSGIANFASGIASGLNKDNLQRAWDISAGAVSAIAETAEGALRNQQTSRGGGGYQVSQGGGYGQTSLGGGGSRFGGFGGGPGSSNPPYPQSSGLTMAHRDTGSSIPGYAPYNPYDIEEKKKKSHKSRRRRSYGDEDHEAAKRKEKRKSKKKKKDAFYSDESDEDSSDSAAERARRKREKEAEREREKEREKEKERKLKAMEREREERERERERLHRSMVEAVMKEKERDKGQKHKDKNKDKDKEKKEKSKKKKDRKERDHEKTRTATKQGSSSEDDVSDNAVMTKETNFQVRQGQSELPFDLPIPRRKEQGDVLLDRLFGDLALDATSKPTLLDEVFGIAPTTSIPQTTKVTCPGCGLHFCPSEVSTPAANSMVEASSDILDTNVNLTPSPLEHHETPTQSLVSNCTPDLTQDVPSTSITICDSSMEPTNARIPTSLDKQMVSKDACAPEDTQLTPNEVDVVGISTPSHESPMKELSPAGTQSPKVSPQDGVVVSEKQDINLASIQAEDVDQLATKLHTPSEGVTESHATTLDSTSSEPPMASLEASSPVSPTPVAIFPKGDALAEEEDNWSDIDF
mmetsp:Transcript_52574/g.93821  ORF Transcript_52574/g.93821 Transcript_52574/m.93821 type:complete len:588 (-) Transcript_52574:1502-3265(-)